MIQLNPQMQAFLASDVYRFASCWRITRQDQVVLRYTNHDGALVIGSEAFTPAGSFNASARQKQDIMQSRNLDLMGFITSDAITHEDLRGGRYRGAKVEEYLVDWEFPWAGNFRYDVYWVTNTQFSGENWKVTVEGLTSRLNQQVGRVFQRRCNHDFCDDGCQLVPADFTYGGVITVATSRRVIQVNLTSLPSAVPVNTYFASGRMSFSSGLNQGVIHDIQMSAATGFDYLITFAIDLPFAPQIGDAFTMMAGCDRTFTQCTVFNNIVNFGGFPYVPGVDAYLTLPGVPSPSGTYG